MTVGVRLRPGTPSSLGVRHAAPLTDSGLALDDWSSRPTTNLRQLALTFDVLGIGDELHAHLRALETVFHEGMHQWDERMAASRIHPRT